MAGTPVRMETPLIVDQAAARAHETSERHSLGALASPERLDALHRTMLLDTAPEEPFDRITRLVRRMVGVPVALISLVDADRQFFKSQQGLVGMAAERRETPLADSFCKFVVVTGEPLVISDARDDRLVEHNRGMTTLGVVAYAGMPLVTREGQILGSLCAIDRQPRAWSEADLSGLRDLAEITMAEIERRAARGEAEALAEVVRPTVQPVQQLIAKVRSLVGLISAHDDPRVRRLASLASVRSRTAELGFMQVERVLDVRVIRRRSGSATWDLGRRVAAAVEAARMATETGLLEFSAPPHAVLVACDADALERAVTHLLVSLLHHAHGDEPIGVRVSATPRHGNLLVVDPASTMLAGELTRIVARFQGAAGATEGAEGGGAGNIRMSKGDLIIGSGGIQARTSHALGTRFDIRLPRARGQGAENPLP